MQHPFGALTQNFRLIRLRKFRGQQPTGPTGDGETRVVSAKCLASLNGHLWRPGGTSPPSFSFTRFIVEQCLLKKTKYMTPAHALKTTRSLHGAQYRRHQTYSDALKIFSPHWNSVSPSVANIQLGHSLVTQKFSQKFFCVFVVVFFCFFLFFILSKFQN